MFLASSLGIGCLYFAAALTPAVLLCLYIYKKDKIEKEPAGLLILLLLGGVLAALAAILPEHFGISAIEYVFAGNTAVNVILSSIVIALCEEGAKLLALRIITWKNPNFNYRFDGIVFAAFVSLGFAGFENILYVFDSGLSTALLRAFTSIPAHLSFAVLMGIFYRRAKAGERAGAGSSRRYMSLSFFMPVLLHAVYDAGALMGNMGGLISFTAAVVLAYFLTFRTVRDESTADRPL